MNLKSPRTDLKFAFFNSARTLSLFERSPLSASAAEALKGDMSNKDKVRAELKKANFKSLRGDFKYNTNQFPIQNFYIQETVKDPQGMMTVKTIATAVKDAKDPYYEKCPMK